MPEPEPSSVLLEVGRRIRAAREARFLSQGGLARLLGLTQTAVSYWESGRRSLAVNDLHVVAGALGCSPASLLCDEGRTSEEPNAVPLEMVRLAVEGDMRRWVGPWNREDVARAVLAATLPDHEQAVREKVEAEIASLRQEFIDDDGSTQAQRTWITYEAAAQIARGGTARG